MSEVARDRLMLLGLLFVAWHGSSLAAGVEALPGPGATLTRMAGLMATAELWGEALETVTVLALATLGAALAGLALGTWLATRPLAGEVAEPLLVAFYALPKVTLYPVILLIFGLTLDAKVAFAALHGVVPMTLFTMAGIRAIPPVYRSSARVMGLGFGATFRHVLLPAALPEIVSGLRIGMSLTLLGTLVAEMFASRAGLGYLLVQAIPRLDNVTILALTVLVFAAAIALNVLLMAIERRLRGRSAGFAVH